MTAIRYKTFSQPMIELIKIGFPIALVAVGGITSHVRLESRVTALSENTVSAIQHEQIKSDIDSLEVRHSNLSQYVSDKANKSETNQNFSALIQKNQDMLDNLTKQNKLIQENNKNIQENAVKIARSEQRVDGLSEILQQILSELRDMRREGS